MQRFIAYTQANWLETGLLMRWAIAIAAGVFYGVGGLVGVMRIGSGSMMDSAIFFGVLFMPIALIVIGQPLRRWLLVVVVADLAIQYDINLAFVQDISEMGSIGGFIISLTSFSLIGLYALWLLELLITREKTATRPTFKYALPAFGFIGAGMLSIFTATNTQATLFELALLAQMLLLFAYISGTVRTRNDVIFLLVVMLGVMVFEGLYLLWQRFGPSYAGIRAYRGTDGVYSVRVDGHFKSPNLAGAFFSFFLVPALAFLMLRVHRYWRLFAIFAFAVGGLGIFLTLSRGAWVALAVSTSVFIFFMVLRGWISLSAPMMLSIAVLVLMLLFPELLLERLFGDDGGAAEGRNPLNIIAMSMVDSSPLTGIGLNNFATVLPDFTPLDFANNWLYTVHNKYLLVLSETGGLGLMAFLTFMFMNLWRAWRVWQVGDRFYATIALALFAVICGHMFHMWVDVFNGRPPVQGLWLLAGLIAALYAMVVHGEELDEDGNRIRWPATTGNR